MKSSNKSGYYRFLSSGLHYKPRLTVLTNDCTVLTADRDKAELLADTFVKAFSNVEADKQEV